VRDIGCSRAISHGLFTIFKGKEDEKNTRRKEKLKAKEDEKQEKRRQKEEKLRRIAEKEREREKKKTQKQQQKQSATLHGGGGGGSNAVSQALSLSDFVQPDGNMVPLLLEKCVRFIEEDGLDSEGIYRVPGNRAHVDLLFTKLEEGKFFFLES